MPSSKRTSDLPSFPAPENQNTLAQLIEIGWQQADNGDFVETTIEQILHEARQMRPAPKKSPPTTKKSQIHTITNEPLTFNFQP